MTELEEYYNFKTKQFSHQSFTQLSAKHKAALKSSNGFAVWKLAKAKENLKNATKETSLFYPLRSLIHLIIHLFGPLAGKISSKREGANFRY